MKNNKEEGNKSNFEKKKQEIPDNDNTHAVEVPLHKEAVSQLIKVLRKTRKYSQEQFGELIGVQKSQVSKLEKGSNNITLGTMIKIFTALKAKVIIKVEVERKEELKYIEKKLKDESEEDSI